MKRILLVNPWIYDFAAYDFRFKPLGLLYIAGWLRKCGYQVNVIDCLDSGHPDLASETHIKPPRRKTDGTGHFPKELVQMPSLPGGISRKYYRFGITPKIFQHELLAVPAPDLVFVTSMMTYWYPGVVAAIAAIREVFPAIPVILGGHYASLCTDHAKRVSGADEVLTGNGEVHLPAILKKYLNDDVQNQPSPEELDSLPYPAFDLLRKPICISLLISRGCPFRCTYCASSILNTRFRMRDPIKVVDEIEFWNVHHGALHFSFCDDALLIHSHDVIIPMMREILKRRLECRFHCPNGLHLREMTAEIARLMRATGFETLRFGFETSDRTRQQSTGEKVSGDELFGAIRYLKDAGYATKDIGVYLLCGLPGQTAGEISESIRFVKSCGARPMLAEYSPIPHTALWHEAVLSSKLDIANEPLCHNNTLIPCRDDSLSDDVYHVLKRMTRAQ
jgi:radical SAM superfamily enzyme YgiQ (UPF0313 family)